MAEHPRTGPVIRNADELRQLIAEKGRQHAAQLPETGGHPRPRCGSGCMERLSVQALPGSLSPSDLPRPQRIVTSAVLYREGVCASSGLVCLADSDEPSHVVKAMKPDSAASRQMIRFSLGARNSADDMESAIDAVRRAVKML